MSPQPSGGIQFGQGASGCANSCASRAAPHDNSNEIIVIIIFNFRLRRARSRRRRRRTDHRATLKRGARFAPGHPAAYGHLNGLRRYAGAGSKWAQPVACAKPPQSSPFSFMYLARDRESFAGRLSRARRAAWARLAAADLSEADFVSADQIDCVHLARRLFDRRPKRARDDKAKARHECSSRLKGSPAWKGAVKRVAVVIFGPAPDPATCTLSKRDAASFRAELAAPALDTNWAHERALVRKRK